MARPSPAPPRDLTVRAFALRFLVAFGVLEALVYLLLWRDAWFAPYAELNARLSAWVFGVFLEDARGQGPYLVTPQFSIYVRPGCDAYQACAVLLAGVLAFPAPRRRKLIGALVGVALLSFLNLARLAALLWTGVHHRERFDLLHLEVLPGIFVAAALVLLLGWARWARRPARAPELP